MNTSFNLLLLALSFLVLHSCKLPMGTQYDKEQVNKEDWKFHIYQNESLNLSIPVHSAYEQIVEHKDLRTVSYFQQLADRLSIFNYFKNLNKQSELLFYVKDYEQETCIIVIYHKNEIAKKQHDLLLTALQTSFQEKTDNNDWKLYTQNTYRPNNQDYISYLGISTNDSCCFDNGKSSLENWVDDICTREKDARINL